MRADLSSRRRFITKTGTAVGAVALAGCSGGGGGDGSGTATDSRTTTSTEGGDYSAAERRAIDYLTNDNGTGNFDGSFVDQTGVDEVSVDVGAAGNGGNFAYAPPALTVSVGTTVSWQWTGKGGNHNVLSAAESDFDIDSGTPKESGDPFERSFDDTGVVLYYCTPHRTLGMKGAVVVE